MLTSHQPEVNVSLKLEGEAFRAWLWVTKGEGGWELTPFPCAPPCPTAHKPIQTSRTVTVGRKWKHNPFSIQSLSKCSYTLDLPTSWRGRTSRSVHNTWLLTISYDRA